MDFFEDHKVEIEKALCFKLAALMTADVDLIFYDTTSLHFEIDEPDEADLSTRGRSYEALRKRGHSKNGREDAPQIVVGLAVTRDGLPVRSWVFPGNTTDVTTVEKVKADLRGWKLGRCVLVGDAGMNSEDNRKKLRLGSGKYILGAKMRANDEVTKEVLARPGRYKEVKDNLRVNTVMVGDGERRRRYVVCHNPDEETRQRTHREKVIEELTAELATLQERPDGTHTTRAHELLTSGRFRRYLRQVGTGGLTIDRAAVKDAERYDGKWVITSNDGTLTADDLALGYKQLLRVGRSGRATPGATSGRRSSRSRSSSTSAGACGSGRPRTCARRRRHCCDSRRSHCRRNCTRWRRSRPLRSPRPGNTRRTRRSVGNPCGFRWLCD